MAPAGFVTEKVISALFQRPDEVRHMEEAKEGYSPDAGFTIIVAGKKTAEDANKEQQHG